MAMDIGFIVYGLPLIDDIVQLQNDEYLEHFDMRYNSFAIPTGFVGVQIGVITPAAGPVMLGDLPKPTGKQIDDGHARVAKLPYEVKQAYDELDMEEGVWIIWGSA